MFITDTDLQEHPELASEVSMHMARLNHNAKLVGAPVFNLGARTKMAVRLRKPAHGAASSLGMHQFAGGESFRIDNIATERRGHLAGVQVAVTLCPAKAVLAMEIASMTMALDQAFHVFPELEAWCDTDALLKHTQGAQDRAHEHAALESLPTVDEARSNPLWGAW